MPGHKPTLVFDFDGVLSQSPDYRWPLSATDFGLLRDAMAAGYPCAVSTCNDVMLVSQALHHAGIPTMSDPQRRYGQDGWREADIVLVTNMKVSGVIIDDRCINWTFGEASFEALEPMVADQQAKRTFARRHMQASEQRYVKGN